jgi:tetratricopeptide (TPR) repeat protein
MSELAPTSIDTKCTRLSPYAPTWYWIWFGLSYRHAGQYQDALRTFKKLLNRAPKGEFSLSAAHGLLAGTCAMMSQYRKARLHWKKNLNISPILSLGNI